MKIKSLSLGDFVNKPFADAANLLGTLGCTPTGYNGRFGDYPEAIAKEGSEFTIELHGENNFILVKAPDGRVTARGFAYGADTSKGNFHIQLLLDGDGMGRPPSLTKIMTLYWAQ